MEELATKLRVSEETPRTSTNAESIPTRGLYTEEARNNRLNFLREQTGLELNSMKDTRLQADMLRGHIENFIGGIEIPVGVAGPLIIRREGEEDRLIYAPIATTEGALVSSITRGAKAASICGGIFAKALRQRMTRAPMFELSNISEAARFAEHAVSRLEEIRAIVKKHSNFSKLIELEPVIVGRTVHLCFIYETGDASGQNMTTICTMNAATWLIDDTKESCGITTLDFCLEGNLSTDKKASFRSAIIGRGTQVVAECRIERKVLRRILKVTPEAMLRIYNRGTAASPYAGMLGFNINVANIVAGIFAATGQDIACVHESSVAQLHMELDGDALYASLSMPSLVVGTVGGGTRIPAQNEMLRLLGCEGAHNSAKLAETICAFALALDLSTMAAMVGGQFASAHERLGRSKEQLWLKKDEINETFFAQILKPHFTNLSSAHPKKLTLSATDSLVIESASQVTKRLCGLFPFDVEVKHANGTTHQPLLLKVKPTDREVILATELMGALCNSEIAQAYKDFPNVNPFVGCHVREMQIYEQTDSRFTSIAPRFFGNIRDDRREIYVLAMEYFSAENIPTLGHPTKWSASHLRTAIHGIAGFHSIWLGRESELQSMDWINSIPTTESLIESRPLWKALATHAHDEFSSWFTEQDYVHQLTLIERLSGSARAKIDGMLKTLIHNDFNPRNVVFKRGATGEHDLCAYDWELATVHIPQRDVAELLAFTLDQHSSGEEILHYVDTHREALEAATDKTFDARAWVEGFRISLEEFMITRLAMYFVAHSHRSCDFLPRVYRTSRHMLDALEKMGY